MEYSVFIQLSVLMGITVSIAFVMRALRQPLLIAYLISGIVAGPIFLNVLNSDVELFHELAELGVIFLLFLVGLSLNVNHIRRLGPAAVVTGVGQLVFTAGMGYLILQILGYGVTTSIYLAMAITFSSTIIVVKLLSDKKDLQSTYGQSVLGLLVVQDIIAIAIMLVITTTNTGGDLTQLAGELALRGLIMIALIYFFSKYVLPHILNSVAKNGEFLFIFTMAWVFGVSALSYLAGFSVEIGAIIAGVSLGSSPYQPQISSRMRPLRDFFIVIFFLLLGSEMSLTGALEGWFPGLVLALFILFGNPFILYFLYRSQKFSRRNSFLAGVTAAQVSEFGFIVLFTGQQFGIFDGSELPIFTIVALITIFISSYLITYNEQIYRFLIPVFQFFGGEDRHVQKEHKDKKYDVILFGYHRIGWKVAETLQEMGKSFVIIDFNPVALKRARGRGIDAIFGDAADVEFLSALPLDTAKLIISTMPEFDDQLTLLKEIKQQNPKAKTILNLYHSDNLKELYEAGADFVMMPHLLGGAWLSELLTNHKRLTKTMFKDLRKDQKKEMELRYTAATE